MIGYAVVATIAYIAGILTMLGVGMAISVWANRVTEAVDEWNL